MWRKGQLIEVIDCAASGISNPSSGFEICPQLPSSCVTRCSVRIRTSIWFAWITRRSRMSLRKLARLSESVDSRRSASLPADSTIRCRVPFCNNGLDPGWVASSKRVTSRAGARNRSRMQPAAVLSRSGAGIPVGTLSRLQNTGASAVSEKVTLRTRSLHPSAT